MAGHSPKDELVRMGDVSGHLESFSKTTRIPIRLLDRTGRILWNSHFFSGKTNVCSLLQSNGFSKRACVKAHREAVRESVRWGETIISRCCYFLMQIAAPVMEKGRLIGGLVASPFLLVDPSDLQPEEILLLGRGKGQRNKAIERSLSSITIVRDEEVRKAADLLFRLADQLSLPDLGGLLRVREAQELQGEIADQICAIKNLDKDFTPYSLSKLFYEREREIITKIRLGEREGAKEILHQLLAIILIQYLENFDLLKISVLELLIILSRAAVEAGAKMEEMLGIRYSFVTELARIGDQETLCLWIVRVFEKLCDRIYQTRNAKNYQRLKKVMDFIETHHSESLTVEQIAQEIYLSPSRLSHIIKDEFGMTLIDYVSRVRVDRAKGLLRNVEFSIAQIAQEVGFSDQSYFTKVFKRIEGCTPKAYRVNLSQPSVPN